MSRARRAAVLPLAVAIGSVLLGSSPAWATVKATWGSPTDNSTYTTTNPITFTVTLDRGAVLPDGATVNLSLSVPGPTPGPFKVDTAASGDNKLEFTFTPACPNQTGSCATGSAPAYNGRYAASLSGAATGTRTVNLEVPPAAPTGVTAAATGTHRVKVSWAANVEPDLTGYDLYTDQGVTVAANLPKSSTSFEFDLPSSGYGGTHGYVVRAHRLACSNCGTAPGSDAQLDSPFSQPATVTFTEPGATPTADPGTGGTGGDGGYNDGSTTGSGSGSGNSGNNGNGNGGSGSTSTDDPGYNEGGGGGSFTSGKKTTSATDQRTAFGLTFKSFAPKLGAPKLPPQPQFAGEAPLPEGTYNPTLNYGDQTVTEQQTLASGDSITEQFVDSVTAAFEGRKLYRSIAIALLLFLAAAHLRIWLRHTDAA